jgi:HrpA-like RNA helicase
MARQQLNNNWRKMQAEIADLPCTKQRHDICKVILDNFVTVLSSETGSGKSTQVPKALAEAQQAAQGWACIACVQPRRLAAERLAKRVALEMGIQIGKEVGYAVRGDKQVSASTLVQYSTDGWLVKQALHDWTFSRYSAIILDEFHGRSLANDLLFAMVRLAQQKRPDLKLVIMSATLQAASLKDIIGNCGFLDFSGRRYDIVNKDDPTPDTEYLQRVVDRTVQVLQKPLTGNANDIGIFLPGKNQIMKTKNRLEGVIGSTPQIKKVIIHGELGLDKQMDLAATVNAGGRVIFFLTNVAEASLTLPNLRYVIDSGRRRKARWCSQLKMLILETCNISASSKKQRSGRAGRTCK